MTIQCQETEDINRAAHGAAVGKSTRACMRFSAASNFANVLVGVAGGWCREGQRKESSCEEELHIGCVNAV